MIGQGWVTGPELGSAQERGIDPASVIDPDNYQQIDHSQGTVLIALRIERDDKAIARTGATKSGIK